MSIGCADVDECGVHANHADKPTDIVMDIVRLSGLPCDLTWLCGSERGQVAGAAVATGAAKPDGLVVLAKAHNVKPGAPLKAVFPTW